MKIIRFPNSRNRRALNLLAKEQAAQWVRLNCNTCAKSLAGDCELLTRMILTAKTKIPDHSVTARMGAIKDSASPGGYDFFSNKCTELEPRLARNENN